MFEQQTYGGHTFDFVVDTDAEEQRLDRWTPAEQELLEAFTDAAEQYDVVWDVGANIGAYTLTASRHATVTAFEPHISSYHKLREHLRINNMQATTLPIALSQINGHVSFDQNPESGYGLNAIGNGDWTVPTLRADTFGVIPDVVKIDVEGAEGNVLDGFGVHLADVEQIFVEVHLDAPHRPSIFDYQYDIDAMESMLDSFSIEVAEEKSDREFWICS